MKVKYEVIVGNKKVILKNLKALHIYLENLAPDEYVVKPLYH